MRRIKNENLAELLMQLRFTPKKQRRKQLDAAEKLFAIIDKNKEYPFEFVCFRITGFHPKGDSAQQLIKGDELAEYLQIFISKLSAQLARPVWELTEEVYTINQLAAALSISTKTIDRWRKRGLIAKKFIFKDGKKRLGFLQSTVVNFARANPQLITKARTFQRLTDKQKQQIITQARKLAANTNFSRYQIISRISAKLKKAHETIRYTLLNDEKAHPHKPIFKKPSCAIDPATVGEIYKLYKQDTTAKELIKRFSRSKSSIYRLINIRRARALLAKKIEFVNSDEFLQDDAKEKILAKPIDIPRTLDHKSAQIPLENLSLTGQTLDLATRSLPEYLQTLKNTPVLNRELEVQLFRRYNYLKYLAYLTRAGSNPSSVSSTKLKQIEDYLAQAEKIKKIIIEANLRLVVSTASKHSSSGANLADLVSEGNVSLMNAIEKFDYTKGFRFATYASWTIAKDYAHRLPAQIARPGKAIAASLANIQRDLKTKQALDFADFERARQSLAQVIKNELTQREQYVILNRFGPIGSPIKKKTKTLKQIGDELGLTKERVRQIELTALQKLRQSLSSEDFELLTS